MGGVCSMLFKSNTRETTAIELMVALVRAEAKMEQRLATVDDAHNDVDVPLAAATRRNLEEQRDAMHRAIIDLAAYLHTMHCTDATAHKTGAELVARVSELKFEPATPNKRPPPKVSESDAEPLTSFQDEMGTIV